MSVPRLKHSGAFYHIYTRGVEKRVIFQDDFDYEKFLRLMQEGWHKYAFQCYAYCLMPNHYHLFMNTPKNEISELMRWLNAKYARYFNLQWDRTGTLFERRFQSEIVDKDSYSLQLSRYIHLNPVRANLVKNPEDWKWSSYRSYAGQAEKPAFLNTAWLLKQFGGDFLQFYKFTLAGESVRHTASSLLLAPSYP